MSDLSELSAMNQRTAAEKVDAAPVRIDAARDFSVRAYVAQGMAPDDAAIVTENALWADLRGVDTVGAQQYNGDTTLRGVYTTANGAFGVDGATQLGSAVWVLNGDVTFTGEVSGANALTVITAGTTTYGGAVDIASLNHVGTGRVAINGGSVTTTGTQNYAARIELGDDTTLSGSTVTLRDGVDGAKGYTQYYDVEVVNGELRGAQGTPGEPGSFELRGTIAADGTAALRRNGLVSNTEFAINQAPRGKAYSFRVNAKFQGTTGIGQRMSGRPCEFKFSR